MTIYTSIYLRRKPCKAQLSNPPLKVLTIILLSPLNLYSFFCRCHLNNLENIVPFVTIGLFYVLTEPDPWTAALCFRSFLVTRVVHNIALIQALPQPTRTFSYLAGVIILCFMSLSVFQRGKM